MGRPRIDGELLKLGFELAVSTVLQVHDPTRAPTFPELRLCERRGSYLPKLATAVAIGFLASAANSLRSMAAFSATAVQRGFQIS